MEVHSHIKLLDVHSHSLSDWWRHSHKDQHIRLTDVHRQKSSISDLESTPISDWWKYTHISNRWMYIHKACQTDGGTATKTNTSDWQTYIDKNPAYQT